MTRAHPATLIVVAALALAVIVYARLLPAPFLSWDDDRNIVLNPLVRGADFAALWRAPWFGLYVPVTSTVWTLVWHLGGGSAAAFRVANLALHLATTCLVWRLLLRLGEAAGESRASGVAPAGGGVPVPVAAAIGAAIFALHPLQTATVAWISGGRDLLATCLALAALLVWLRGRRAAAVWATLLFALALLSKPSVAAVPLAVLAACAVVGRGTLRRSAPVMGTWLALSAMVALVTSAVQTEMTGLAIPFVDRPAVALDALGFYLLKVVAPVGLAADHGRTPDALAAHAGWLVPTLSAVALMVVALVRPIRKRTPAAAWAVAGVALVLPVLGITPFAFQRISTVADHYAYLPMVAVAGLASWLVATRAPRGNAAWLCCVAVLVAYAGLSWNRVGIWRNDRFFFADMVARNPASFAGLSNLAKLSCDAGDMARGVTLSARALAVDASNPPTLAVRADCLYRYGSYGAVVAMRGRLASADVQRTMAHDDASAAAFVNTIAGALFQRGDITLGLVHLCQAIALRPDDAYLRENLADLRSALARRGQVPECSGRPMPWSALAALEAGTNSAAR